jgi:hypothetical protein
MARRALGLVQAAMEEVGAGAEGRGGLRLEQVVELLARARATGGAEQTR